MEIFVVAYIPEEECYHHCVGFSPERCGGDYWDWTTLYIMADTYSPTPAPIPTPAPSTSPTPGPSTLDPTPAPSTLHPTPAPTTPFPTPTPTYSPTPSPTDGPTPAPTPRPTPGPTTLSPTLSPTPYPTPRPTMAPSPHPSPGPTPAPTPSIGEHFVNFIWILTAVIGGITIVAIVVYVLLVIKRVVTPPIEVVLMGWRALLTLLRIQRGPRRLKRQGKRRRKQVITQTI